MTKQQKHSQLINSASVCQAFNNDMPNIRKALRDYCLVNDCKGELLNAYNKTYIYTDSALKAYILGSTLESRKLPLKASIDFLSDWI